MFHKPQLNNPYFNDCYFSYDEGIEEARTVSVVSSGIIDIAGSLKNDLTVGETGFGTGLNFLALLMSLYEEGIHRKLNYYTVDKYPLSCCRIRELFTSFDERLKGLDIYLDSWDQIYKNIKPAWNVVEFSFFSISVNLHFYNGDVMDMLNNLDTSMSSWFLDGHSPHKNPEMWDEQVMLKIGEHTLPNGTFATFTAANAVGKALRKAGFEIEKIQGFGGKKHMLRGIKKEQKNE